MKRNVLLLGVAALGLALAGAAPASAVDYPIQWDTVVTGVANGPDNWGFQANGPGMVAATCWNPQNQGDLVLSVVDAAGNELVHGDDDIAGIRSYEFVAVAIPAAGWYSVRVQPFSGSGVQYNMMARWVDAPAYAAPSDDTPEGANEIGINMPLEDTLDVSSDQDDWFAYAAPSSGTLTIVTDGQGGDIVLDVYDQNQTQMGHSDQDIGGNRQHEILSVQVQGGWVYFIKVHALSGSNFAYRITASQS